MSALISVIIPVFNSADRLSRCLDSILRQQYQEWELILVDDGSTDDSPIICDNYSLSDSRIRVFHRSNAGVSAARNYGILQSNGKWMCFVDSDDWLDPNYLNDFVLRISEGSDLILQGYVKERGETEIGRRHLLEGHVIEASISNYLLDNDLIDFGSPCCKLFKHSIIEENSLFFPDSYSYGEDTVFFFKYLKHCHSLSCIGKEGYHYVENTPESLSRRVHHSLQLLHFVKDSALILNDSINGPAKKLILERQNSKNVALANRAIINMYLLGYDNEQKKDVITFLRSTIRPILYYEGLSVHDRVFLFISGLPEVVQLKMYDILKAIGGIKTPTLLNR